MESHPDGLPPVRPPPAGRHAVSQDEFIYPLPALDAAQRRHLFFKGQAELFTSRQEPSAPCTGLHGKREAVRSEIVRIFSVKALRSCACHRRFLVPHDTSHPFGGVPMRMLVCVTGLVTSMTSQTPPLFENLPLVACRVGDTGRLPPSSVRQCRFDYSAEIAYGKLGPSLARIIIIIASGVTQTRWAGRAGKTGGARRARVNSELRTQNPELRPTCRSLTFHGPLRILHIHSFFIATPNALVEYGSAD